MAPPTVNKSDEKRDRDGGDIRQGQTSVMGNKLYMSYYEILNKEVGAFLRLLCLSLSMKDYCVLID